MFPFDNEDDLNYALRPPRPQTVIDQLPRDSGGRWRLGNIVDNFATGVRQGMMLDNLLFQDPEVQQSADLPIVRIVGLLGGAIAEGAVTQSWMLRGLQAVSKSSKVPKVAAAAKSALDRYLVGEDIDILRRTVGHAMLGVSSEALLNAAAGVETEDALRNVGLAAVGGATFGGVQMALDTRKAAKAGFLNVENSLDGLSKRWQGLRSGVNEYLRFEHSLRKYQGFIKGLSLEERDLSDEMSFFVNREGRMMRLAETELRLGIAKPLDSAKNPESWKRFRELVEVSKEEALVRVGKQKGDLGELTERRRILEASAPQEVKLAFESHKNFVRAVAEKAQKYQGMSVSPLAQQLDAVEQSVDANFDLFSETQFAARELAASGAPGELVDGVRKESAQALQASREQADLAYAHAVSDFEQFVTHRVGHKIQFLRRGTFIERDSKAIEDTAENYFARMGQALFRARRDDLIDEFVEQLRQTHEVKLGEIPFDAQRRLLDGVAVELPDGRKVKQFNLQPGQVYPAWAVSDAGADLLNKLSFEASKGPLKVDASRLPIPDPVWAIRTPGAIVLPTEIGDRITKKFFESNPFKIDAPGFKQLQELTAKWKVNTIWWGLTRFATGNMIGDGVNLGRSNPQALKQIPKAIQTVFARYRTPVKTPEQLQTAMLGAGIGAGVGLLDGDSDNLIGSALLGAGVGYAYRTAKLAGSAEAQPLLEKIYEEADARHAINAGQFIQETDMAHRIIGGNVGSRLGSGGESRPIWDTALTLLSGRVHGDPTEWATRWVQAIETVQNERENIMRLAGFIQGLEEGLHPAAAARRTSAALVDYSRFTDFENKYLRGFLLPFYSFARHNTVNWMRTLGGVTHLASGTRLEGVVPQLGGDVGGKPQAALVATAALGGFDVAAQAWNQAFFGDTEEKLEPWQRERFHVIMGNLATGEVFKDAKGHAMVFSTDLGYEATLEMMGLARPAKVLNLFGAGIPDQQGLVERALLIEEYEGAPKVLREAVDGFTNEVARLLTPVLKVPMELVGNESWMFNAPIVPEHLVGTPESREAMLKYAAQQSFRQYRELSRLDTEVSENRFNPLSNAFGLGLPIDSVDLDAALRRRLHDKLEAAQLAEKKQKAPWKVAIDEIIYARERWDQPKPDEYEKLNRVLAEEVMDPQEYEEAVRYYTEKASKSSVLRHWNTLRLQERARFARSLEGGDMAAFVFYSNGGGNIQRYLQPSPEEMMAFSR